MWMRSEKEALAVSKGLRVSPRKLNDLARLLRGKSAYESLNFLKFSSKMSAKNHLIKVVQSAMANAENNHDLDVDALFVKEMTVNKHKFLKRIRPRARGRADKFIHPYSSVRVILEERVIEEIAGDSKKIVNKKKSKIELDKGVKKNGAKS